MSSSCQFQERSSRRTIGSARVHDEPYFFDDENQESRQGLVYDVASVLISSTKEIILWHHRLGHPNFSSLKHLLPSLFDNKASILFNVRYVSLLNISKCHFIQDHIHHLHHSHWYTMTSGDCPKSQPQMVKNGSLHSPMIIHELHGFIFSKKNQSHAKCSKFSKIWFKPNFSWNFFFNSPFVKRSASCLSKEI